MLFCLASGAAFGAMAVFGKLAYAEGATVGTLLIGTCSGALASGGNISVDPQFARERPRTAYRLTAGSPAIDAAAPPSVAGSTDAAGRPRVVDGNGDGSAVIDLGAYEFNPTR